jgi:hypothetical protein
VPMMFLMAESFKLVMQVRYCLVQCVLSHATVIGMSSLQCSMHQPASPVPCSSTHACKPAGADSSSLPSVNPWHCRQQKGSLQLPACRECFRAVGVQVSNKRSVVPAHHFVLRRYSAPAVQPGQQCDLAGSLRSPHSRMPLQQLPVTVT